MNGVRIRPRKLDYAQFKEGSSLEAVEARRKYGPNGYDSYVVDINIKFASEHPDFQKVEGSDVFEKKETEESIIEKRINALITKNKDSKALIFNRVEDSTKLNNNLGNTTHDMLHKGDNIDYYA